MRKKNKQSVRDVRDIFGTSESPVSNGQGSKGMIRGAEENMEKISGKYLAQKQTVNQWSKIENPETNPTHP